MTDRRLLDRQVRLLAYLTSRAAIFDGVAPLDPLLRGFDADLLRLEARMSFEKRMAKIRDVFPRTLEILGDTADAVGRAFADTCPPGAIGRMENAEQFYRLLQSRWRREPVAPPYVRDVAACEIAIARARTRADRPEPREDAPDARTAIRRHPNVVLLRSAYDVRPVFEGRRRNRIAKRDTPLAIVVLRGTDRPHVFEVMPVVFRMLAALDRWTDPAAIGAPHTLDGVVRDLAARGLVEIRS